MKWHMMFPLTYLDVTMACSRSHLGPQKGVAKYFDILITDLQILQIISTLLNIMPVVCFDVAESGMHSKHQNERLA